MLFAKWYPAGYAIANHTLRLLLIFGGISVNFTLRLLFILGGLRIRYPTLHLYTYFRIFQKPSRVLDNKSGLA